MLGTWKPKVDSASTVLALLSHPSSPLHAFCLFCFLRQRLIFVALAGVGFTIQTQWVLNSQRSAYLCLPSAGIKGVSHHAQFCVCLVPCRQGPCLNVGLVVLATLGSSCLCPLLFHTLLLPQETHFTVKQGIIKL